MNDFATLPVQVIGEESYGRLPVTALMTRVPCVGEFIHLQEGEKGEPALDLKVLAVRHLDLSDLVGEVRVIQVHTMEFDDVPTASKKLRYDLEGDQVGWAKNTDKLG